MLDSAPVRKKNPTYSKRDSVMKEAASPTKVDQSPRTVLQGTTMDGDGVSQQSKVSVARKKFEVRSSSATRSPSLRKSSTRKSGSIRVKTITIVPYQSPAVAQEEWGLRHKSGRAPHVARGTFFVPPPPLFHAPTTAAARPPKKPYARKNRSASRYATVMQSAVRGFLTRKQMEAKVCAAIKIQARFRAWLCQAKLRLAELQLQLERSQQRREYSLQWIQQGKQQDMQSFERSTRLAADKNEGYLHRNVTKSKDEIQKLRAKNKKLRSQNKVLTDANKIQAKRVQEQQVTGLEYARQNTILEKKIPKLEREQKRSMTAEAMYHKFVQQALETLSIIQEHIALEQKITADTKDTVLNLMELIQQDCTDDDALVHEILEIGMNDSFANTKQLQHKKETAVNDQLHSAKEKIAEKAAATKTKKPVPKKRDSDMSGTETSETVSSDDDGEIRELSSSLHLRQIKDNSPGWVKDMPPFDGDSSEESSESYDRHDVVAKTSSAADSDISPSKGKGVLFNVGDIVSAEDHDVFVFEDGEESATAADVIVSHVQKESGSSQENTDMNLQIKEAPSREEEESVAESGAGWESDDESEGSIEEEILPGEPHNQSVAFSEELVEESVASEEEVIEEEVIEDYDDANEVIVEEYVLEVGGECDTEAIDNRNVSSVSCDESTIEEEMVDDEEIIIEEEIVEEESDEGGQDVMHTKIFPEDLPLERGLSSSSESKLLGHAAPSDERDLSVPSLSNDYKSKRISFQPAPSLAPPESPVSSILTGPVEADAPNETIPDEDRRAMSPSRSYDGSISGLSSDRSSDRSAEDGNYGLWCYEDQIKDLLARQRKPAPPPLSPVRVRDLLKKFERPQGIDSQ